MRRARSLWIGRLQLLAVITTVAFLLLSHGKAEAGRYVVAQCSPGLYPAAPDAGFVASSYHYAPEADCSLSAPGMVVYHYLNTGETGSVKGAYGGWVWQAPPGTYIIGGSTYSRLATEDGEHGYLAVSPDAGAGLSYENQNDNQGHEAGIPAGNWRYLVARLECTQPNENGRCVGNAPAAHMFVKQVRLELADVVAPTLSLGGSMFSGEVLRGSQTVVVSAADIGAGLESVQILVNGQAAGGDDLSAACNPLPGNMASRLSPCLPSLNKTYSLDTSRQPFRRGSNAITICAYDYTQIGTPNSTCQSQQVVVDNLCPGSPVGGGATIVAAFAGNGRAQRTLAFHRRALVRGRLRDAAGNPVAGASVCIQGHTNLPGRPFRLIGVANTNPNGGWSFKLHHGPSRDLRVAYRFGAFQTSTELALRMRARATLHLSRHRTGPRRRIYFSGSIPGPHPGRRVVVIRGSVPGANRRFLVRRARTDQLGHYRVGYAFSAVPAITRFVFWALVPEQNGYPYLRGHSVARYVRVRP